jgi:cysteinyl-tRNA synthetase
MRENNMILYNTLTRKKEKFEPLENNTARIYSCGPTVYTSPTIGNMRAFIFTDVLKKALRLNGFDIMDVINVTDVGHLTTDADEGEDKLESSAKKAGIDPQQIAKTYTDEFMGDIAALNIKTPKIIAPATDYITEMIEFVSGLENKGYTYKTSDGVYFDSSKFPNYPNLSGSSIEGNKAGARIDLGKKKNAHDFALWKLCGGSVIQKWDSPWGVGCPGWHIECSAIARKHLGDTFDIHTGGIDLIPIHHTNEIAQTESLTGKKMCQFWCHNEFMTIDGGKMSKSLGNAYTITQLTQRGYSPMIFRYFVLLATYRTILNFSFPALDSAKTAYNNLVALLAKHKTAAQSEPLPQNIFEDFKSAMANDLNTPQAIAILWQAAKSAPNHAVYDLIVKMDETLSLDLEKSVEELLNKKPEENVIPTEIEQLAEQRLDAKKNKDWATADMLRAKITDAGFRIVDNPSGYIIEKSN